MTRAWWGIDARGVPLLRAGIVLGLGIGGFFDGIVFHQILQVHHMLTAHPDPAIASDVELNVLADGLFHLVTYLLTLTGIALVWSAWRKPDVPPSGRSLVGSMLVGWGVFNLVEGAINHHVAAIHHVWSDGPGGALVWDVAFLLWGAVMLVMGAVVVRTDPALSYEQRPDERPEEDPVAAPEED